MGYERYYDSMSNKKGVEFNMSTIGTWKPIRILIVRRTMRNY